MQGSQAIAEVQQILGWRSDKAAECLSALNYAQVLREGPGTSIPWWLLQEDVSLPAVTIGNPVVPLPADYLQDYEEAEGNLRYTPTSPVNARTVFLKKMDFETAEKFYYGDWSTTADQDGNEIATVSPGVPKAYVLRKNSIKIYPAPDKAYVLTWSYWGRDAAITSNAENKWLANAPWVLIGDAAKKLGSDLGNANAVNTASALVQMAEANMFRAIISREEAGRSRNMGSRL